MPLRYSIATLTDVGQQRTRNEDAVAHDDEHALVVVADGMGGHPAGDVASRLAVEEAVGALTEDGDAPADDTSGPEDESTPEQTDQDESSTPGRVGRDEEWRDRWGEHMAEAVRSADRRVRSEGLRNPEWAGMGTTLTVFQLDPGSGCYVIGHVGDSRAYLLRDGTLQALTRDDTWVQEQVDKGHLDAEHARYHPWGSMLSQALGLDEPAEPAVVNGRAEPGDVYLLCSDGLVAMLEDGEIEYLLTETLPEGIEATARILVKAANRRGGVDNITVGLLRVDASDPVAWERDPD